MDGEVIIVAVDASKEITDYVVEWAEHNVTKPMVLPNMTKPMDSLILLALLPLTPTLTNHFLSYTSLLLIFFQVNGGVQLLMQLACLLIIGLPKKWALGHCHKEENSSPHACIHKAVQQDMPLRINNVCVHMMRQLCLVHNKQVLYFLFYVLFSI